MNSKDVALLASKSLILEASVWPKPGLVTPIDSGSHDRMDFFTFVDSAMALFGCFEECAQVGMDMCERDPAEVFLYLRRAGKEAERKMCTVTAGQNTHKGAIFSMGLLCAGTARLKARKKGLEAYFVAREAASFISGIVDMELSSLKSRVANAQKLLSSGERIYLEYGITGARGEAERGFPLALAAHRELRQNREFLEERAALAQTLIYVIAENENDTNLVVRGGIEGLRFARVTAANILAAGGLRTPQGSELLAQAERAFVEKRLSPGGSADILSAAIFFSRLELLT